MASILGKNLNNKLRALINEIRSPGNMAKYGQMAADMIKLRTRLGYGVANDGAERQKLKPLADSTIQARAGRIAFFEMKGVTVAYPRDSSSFPIEKLSDQTSAKKSNLTHTGQLLDSMKVIGATVGKAIVGPSGPRKEGRLTNQKLAEYVTAAGRPFNNLSKVETKRVQDQLRRDLKALLKKALTK